MRFFICFCFLELKSTGFSTNRDIKKDNWSTHEKKVMFERVTTSIFLFSKLPNSYFQKYEYIFRTLSKRFHAEAILPLNCKELSVDFFLDLAIVGFFQPLSSF